MDRNNNNGNNGNNTYFRPDGYGNTRRGPVPDEHLRAAQLTSQPQLRPDGYPDPLTVQGPKSAELLVAMNQWNDAVNEHHQRERQVARGRGAGYAHPQQQQPHPSAAYPTPTVNPDLGHGSAYPYPYPHPHQQQRAPNSHLQVQQHTLTSRSYPSVKQEPGASYPYPVPHPQQQPRIDPSAPYPQHATIKLEPAVQRAPRSSTRKVKNKEDEAATKRDLAGSSSTGSARRSTRRK